MQIAFGVFAWGVLLGYFCVFLRVHRKTASPDLGITDLNFIHRSDNCDVQTSQGRADTKQHAECDVFFDFFAARLIYYI